MLNQDTDADRSGLAGKATYHRSEAPDKTVNRGKAYFCDEGRMTVNCSEYFRNHGNSSASYGLPSA